MFLDYKCRTVPKKLLLNLWKLLRRVNQQLLTCQSQQRTESLKTAAAAQLGQMRILPRAPRSPDLSLKKATNTSHQIFESCNYWEPKRDKWIVKCKPRCGVLRTFANRRRFVCLTLSKNLQGVVNERVRSTERGSKQ